MLKKLLPIVLLLVGSGAGVGAGIFLRPAPVEEEHGVEAGSETEARTHEKTATEEKHGEGSFTNEYVKMSNQFVIPVVKEGNVISLVVVSLSVEVPQGRKDEILLREPKLRDTFLGVLFDHANIGGFEGAFTETSTLENLRTSLREAGQTVLGVDLVKGVLISDIARQDY